MKSQFINRVSNKNIMDELTALCCQSPILQYALTAEFKVYFENSL